MTRTSFRTGILLCILTLSLLFVPAFGQESSEDGTQAVTEGELEKIQEEVEGLREKLNELSARNEDLDEGLETNLAAVDELKEDQESLENSFASMEETVKDRETELDRVSSLEASVESLENKMEKLVDELGGLDQSTSNNEERLEDLADLEDSHKSLREEVSDLSDEINEVKSSLTKVRENTLDNERKLASLEETYRASTRRNLLVAASGIAIGLAGLTLFWAT